MTRGGSSDCGATSLHLPVALTASPLRRYSIVQPDTQEDTWTPPSFAHCRRP